MNKLIAKDVVAARNLLDLRKNAMRGDDLHGLAGTPMVENIPSIAAALVNVELTGSEGNDIEWKLAVGVLRINVMVLLYLAKMDVNVSNHFETFRAVRHHDLDQHIYRAAPYSGVEWLISRLHSELTNATARLANRAVWVTETERLELLEPILNLYCLAVILGQHTGCDDDTRFVEASGGSVEEPASAVAP